MRHAATLTLTVLLLCAGAAWQRARTPAPELLAWRDGARWEPRASFGDDWRELPQPDGGVVWTEEAPLVIQTPGLDRGSRILVVPPEVESANIERAIVSDDGRRFAFALRTPTGCFEPRGALGLLASEDGFGSAFVAAWLPGLTGHAVILDVAFLDGG